MIRRMRADDIPLVAAGIMELSKRTQLPQFTWMAFNVEDLMKYLIDILVSNNDQVFIETDEGGAVAAAVGVSIEHMKLPPHIRYVGEWCMFGNTAKDIVVAWQACKRWGQGRGALLALRGSESSEGYKKRWEDINEGV